MDFSSANISQYKIRHPRVHEFFNKIGHTCILSCESTFRAKVSEVYSERERQNIIDILTCKHTFAPIDECEIIGNKFVHFSVQT